MCVNVRGAPCSSDALRVDEGLFSDGPLINPFLINPENVHIHLCESTSEATTERSRLITAGNVLETRVNRGIKGLSPPLTSRYSRICCIADSRRLPFWWFIVTVTDLIAYEAYSVPNVTSPLRNRIRLAGKMPPILVVNQPGLLN